MPYRALDPSTAATAPVTTAGAPLVSVGETLFSLRSELLLEIGSRSDVDPTRLNKWINWAYRNLAGMLKVGEMKRSMVFNTVAGQPFYLLPVQVRSIRAISVEDSTNFYRGGTKLTLSDEDEYKRQPDSARTYNKGPRKYFRYNRMVVVYPDPVAVQPLDMEFWVRPDDLTDDTHSPILPIEFHEPLLLHSRHRAWRSLQEFQKANLAANDFLQVLRPLIDTDAEEAGEAPRGLTVARKASDLTRARR